MTLKKIITHCAPTLAGLKTANLFNEKFDNEEELLKEIEKFNANFHDYGLKMIPLKLENNMSMIYVYRINDLQKDLKNDLSKELLSRYGYESCDIQDALVRLSNRIKCSKDFPHEIGLFLGYPPEDVKGFIDNNAQNYKFIGYWKVYGDLESAKQSFTKYRKCQQIYLNCIRNGFSLEQLVIQK